MNKEELVIDVDSVNQPDAVLVNGKRYVPTFPTPLDKPKRWKPEKGEMYWFVSDSPLEVDSIIWDGDDHDEYRYSMGNVYKTQEKAEAWVELQRHIFKFDEPEDGAGYFILDMYPNWQEIDPIKIKDYMLDHIYFRSGTKLPLSATKEDREERLKLLTNVYGK